MIQHDPTTNRLQFILVDSGRNLDRPLVDIKKRHRTATQPLSDSGQRLFGRCGLHSCRGCRQRCNLSLGNVKSLSTSVNICQHFQQFIQLSSNFHPFSHFYTVFLQFPWCSWFTQPCSAVLRSDSSWWWHLCGASAGAGFFSRDVHVFSM